MGTRCQLIEVLDTALTPEDFLLPGRHSCYEAVLPYDPHGSGHPRNFGALDYCKGHLMTYGASERLEHEYFL